MNSKLLVLLLGIVMLLFIVLLINLRNNKQSFVTIKKIQLTLLISMDLVYILIIFLPKGTFLLYIYGLYKSIIIMCFYNFVWFIYKYFNYTKRLYQLIAKIGWLCIFDIIQIFTYISFFKEEAFIFKTFADNNIILQFDNNIMNIIHIIISFFYTTVILIILGNVAFKSSLITKTRNFSIFLFFTVYIIFHFSLIFSNYDIGVSPLLISFSFLIFYLSVIFVSPKAIIYKIFKLVSFKYSDLLLIFDQNSNLIYTNNPAESFFKNKEEINKFANYIYNNIITGQNQTDEVEIDSFTYEKDQETRFYNLKIRFLRETSKNLVMDGKLAASFIIASDITEKKLIFEKIKYLSRFDKLTGIYNQTYFEEKLSQYLKSNENEYVLIGFDIKEYSILNDIFSKEVADAVLIHIGNVLKENMPLGSLYARVFKDQFITVINKTKYTENYVYSLIDKMENFAFSIETYHLYIQVGIYFINNKSLSIQLMIDNCFRAVKEIRNLYEHISYYDKDLMNSIISEQMLSGQLNNSLTNKELMLYLQPQIDNKGNFIGAEALVRWHHPQRGVLSPSLFIPIFEKNGLITKVDEYIWEESCKVLNYWHNVLNKKYSISINVSLFDLKKINLIEKLGELIDKYHIEPKYLNIEITETAIVQNPFDINNLISVLRKKGFKVEMDDFGSGISSLNMLNSIKVDYLKFDINFINNASNNKKAKAVLETMILLSKKLKLKSIVEGIETEDQVELLTQMGCDVMQGYYFSKPLELRDFEKKYIE